MASAWIERPRRGTFRVRWRENGKKHASEWIKSRIEAEDLQRTIEDRLRAAERLRLVGQTLPIEQVIMRWQAARQGQQRMGKGYAIESRRELMKVIDHRATQGGGRRSRSGGSDHGASVALAGVGVCEDELGGGAGGCGSAIMRQYQWKDIRRLMPLTRKPARQCRNCTESLAVSDRHLARKDRDK